MFPGVTVPFGVVKLGIDMMPPRNAGDPYSGYHPLGNVTGFSMMHESGTGGSPKYGVVSQLPIVGVVQNPLVDYAVPRERDDEAYLGYYKSFLGNGVEVELAAEHHVGMIRHTFPEGREEKNVLVDVSHFLPSFRGLGFEQHYVGGGIRIGEDGRYRGHGIYNGGWNYGGFGVHHEMSTWLLIFHRYELDHLLLRGVRSAVPRKNIRGRRRKHRVFRTKDRGFRSQQTTWSTIHLPAV